jgi:hypothetical protein
MPELKKDYEELIWGGTGSVGEVAENRIITCPFGRYEVKIILNNKNEFVDIAEIRINKEFLSYEQEKRLKMLPDEGDTYDKD